MKRIILWVSRLMPVLVWTVAFGQVREKMNMDEDWKFHLGNAADPGKDFNYSLVPIFVKSGGAAHTAIDVRFNDSTWRTLTLPHDWAVELPFENSSDPEVMSHGYKPVGGLYPDNSVGWYRKHFSVARSDSGQRFVIQFDGIFRDSKIWINGFYLGNNASGYCGVSYDITDYLNFDKENVLVVRVDATQYEGWFYEGAGIYRHVWLNRYQDVHVTQDGLFVHTQVRPDAAVVTVETTVINQGTKPSTSRLATYITDRDGDIIGRNSGMAVTLGVNETKTIKQEITIAQPLLWSPERPYLYRAGVVMTSGGQTLDEEKIRFGIRTIRIDSSGLYVNGQYTKIKGVNCHQDDAGVGSALPDYLQYYRINLLKQLGANAYRTSHNTPTPELLDACDSLGMLVLDENRLLNSSPEYLSDFERLIIRDRSRASVFLWSIGNEEGWVQTRSVGKRIAQTLIERQRELDPTRVCTYAADVANVYNGVNEVIPVRGFNYRIFGVDPYHKDHPGQPILGTEMGSTVTTRGIYVKDSIAGYVPDEDETAPPWANTAEQWWPMAAERPWWIGGFVWTGFDYRGEPTPFRWPDINSHFGIMDMCGFPKNIYYYYQSWWTDKDVLHISPHWNWGGKSGQPIDVWVNSNADNVELFLNGKSLGKKDMPRNSHLEWKVNYEPGTLKAVGYKNGRKLESAVETTGPPAEIILTPYKTTLMADGEDVSVINVSVLDKQGREVPDADNMIRFTISGEGKIIGVGNGDPSSHEPDKCAEGAWQRSLFNGKCQILVQAGKHSGAIRFEAKGAGLGTGSTDILTVSPDNVAAVHVDPSYVPKGEAALSRDPGNMLGADISFLPQLEDRGMTFSDKGMGKDPILILKDHGFNYVRLRIFNDPARDSGYSPGKGFCDLQHTLQMAKRVKAAGMKLLLDFHYSDTWADPGKQYKPAAWRNLSFMDMKKALFDYTVGVVSALKKQGTTPDMVQVGNEINHGLVWPEGSIIHPDSMAQLLSAGVDGVKSVDPSIVIMLHIALGGQHDEAVFFLDQVMERKVPFDVIGLSYYPQWHGTVQDLQDNMNKLVKRYGKSVIVAEYSARKEEVNKVAFELPGQQGKGTFIWEPLNTWERVFDKEGKANELLAVYDDIGRTFNIHAVAQAEPSDGPWMRRVIVEIQKDREDGREEIVLWPNGAPGSEDKTGPEKVRIADGGDHVISHIDSPSITLFLPAADKATGVAVIVAPGGGHSELWIDHEGYNPAEWLKERGIAAFVLKYRLAREPNSTYTVDGDELADIQRAIRMVRSHAKEWGIDTARIGVMGFSAGGELAGLAAMRFDYGKPGAADPVDREGCRPAFQVLMYPGNSGRLEVVKDTPPLFIVGGYKDRQDISEGVAKVYLKYKEAGVPAELHIYSDVGHGFGIRATNKGGVAGWPERLTDWLSDMGILKGRGALFTEAGN
jgi:beta-galactosidase